MFENTASLQIHPALGLARVGSSPDGFFLAPEIPGAQPDAGGRFKGPGGRLKRQAARFRIYARDAAGVVLGEVTADHAEITWRVHVANRKAAWYQFINAMDLGADARPAGRRNAHIAGPQRGALIIDPKSRTIVGRDKSGPAFQFDGGTFMGLPVLLGEVRTDGAGRLLVFGGRGRSESSTGKPPTTFANNDNWFDDTSDGTVRASVKINGRTFEAAPAMVAVAPPNYGPGLHGVVTMFDVVLDLFARDFAYPVPARPDFWRHIYPILDRLAAHEAVNHGFYLLFGHGSPSDFREPALLARLMDPSAAQRALRKRIFDWFRAPGGARPEPVKLPPFYGDTYSEVINVGRVALSLTPLQYRWLGEWAAGNFTAGPRPPAPPPRIENLPIAEQPAALDRAPLEDCLGGPFHPGIELTWTLRLASVWEQPFRLRLLPEGDEPRMDFGDQLTPVVALAADGPLRGCAPGTLTWWLGVPWQTDEASCDAGYEQGTYLPVPSFWGARVPNHVLDERSWQRLLATGVPAAQRAKHLGWRQPWLRHLGVAYLERIRDMVAKWDKVGVVVPRDGPSDHAQTGLPARLWVESEVDKPFLIDDSTWEQLMVAEGSREPVQPAGAVPLTVGAGPEAPARRRLYGRGER